MGCCEFVRPRRAARLGEQGACRPPAEHRREQRVGVLDLGDVGPPARGMVASGEDQDRGVDDMARPSAIVLSSVAKRIASRLPRSSRSKPPGLDDRAVQIEVVRHHRRADDADRDVQHRRVGDDLRRAGLKPAAYCGDAARLRQLASSTAKQPAMMISKRDDERLELAEPALLEAEDQRARRARSDPTNNSRSDRRSRCRSLRPGRRR